MENKAMEKTTTGKAAEAISGAGESSVSGGAVHELKDGGYIAAPDGIVMETRKDAETLDNFMGPKGPVGPMEAGGPMAHHGHGGSGKPDGAPTGVMPSHPGALMECPGSCPGGPHHCPPGAPCTKDVK